MYLFAITLFSVFAFLEVFNRNIIEKYKVLIAFACYVFLVFHDGCRWETGSDWDSYLTSFNSIYSIMDQENSHETFEPGFMLIFSTIKVLTDDFTVFLMVQAILFYTAFFYVIFKLSDFPFVSLLVFYMITVPFMGMNRQFLAMALFGIALVMLLDGRRLFFALIAIFAFLFHRTAVLFLPILFFPKRVKKVYIIAGLAVCAAISFSGILDTLSMGAAMVFGSDEGAGQKLDYYVNQSNDLSLLSTVLSLVKKLIWLSLLLFFEDKIDDKDDKYYLLRNIYAFSVMMYVLFNGTALQIIISRGLLYYNLAEMFMIPYVLTIFKQNYGKLLVMFVLVAYCVVNIFKGFSNYGENTDYFVPYKGLFINTGYVRQNTD